MPPARQFKISSSTIAISISIFTVFITNAELHKLIVYKLIKMNA